MFLFPILLFILVPFCFVVFNFFFYIFNSRIKTGENLFKAIQLSTVVIVPIFFILMFDAFEKNECCTDSALFSPEHRIGMYSLLVAYSVFYILSLYRKSIFPPIAELFTNAFLILGIIINILLCIQIHKMELGVFFWVFGNVPILLLLFMELSKNQKLVSHQIEQNELHFNSFIGKLSLSVLKLKPIFKYPLLTVLLIPILILVSLFLLLFGQKPDSLISAFTQTYKHGFSQLDHLCDNVQCGGHFLCSVGANGHQSVVKPIRYGERNGHKIICNRQLLISNAFEDLVQEKFPKIHNSIRKQYNKVGKLVHKHYHIFNNKYVSDFVYLLMKPLELVFLGMLYTFDKKPENRIAMQYVTKNDRQKINSL